MFFVNFGLINGPKSQKEKKKRKKMPAALFTLNIFMLLILESLTLGQSGGKTMNVL